MEDNENIQELYDILNEKQEEEIERVVRAGWPTSWDHRGVYLHLEVSELIETIRGKNEKSNTVSEGADVLSCLSTLLKCNGIPLSYVIEEWLNKK